MKRLVKLLQIYCMSISKDSHWSLTGSVQSLFHFSSVLSCSSVLRDTVARKLSFASKVLQPAILSSPWCTEWQCLALSTTCSWVLPLSTSIDHWWPSQSHHTRYCFCYRIYIAFRSTIFRMIMHSFWPLSIWPEEGISNFISHVVRCSLTRRQYLPSSSVSLLLLQCKKIFMIMYPEQTRILYTISYQHLLHLGLGPQLRNLIDWLLPTKFDSLRILQLEGLPKYINRILPSTLSKFLRWLGPLDNLILSLGPMVDCEIFLKGASEPLHYNSIEASYHVCCILVPNNTVASLRCCNLCKDKIIKDEERELIAMIEEGLRKNQKPV